MTNEEIKAKCAEALYQITDVRIRSEEMCEKQGPAEWQVLMHLARTLVASKQSFVVYNINGDTIGVADSRQAAEAIYFKRYGEAPEREESIREFPVNQMIYQ